MKNPVKAVTRAVVLWALRAVKGEAHHPSSDAALAFLGTPNAAGVTVNESTANTLSAFWNGVNLISDQVGALPLPVYKRLSPRGKERAPAHPLYTLLHDQPNGEMGAMAFRSAMQRHVLISGNAYAEIERTNAGRASGGGIIALHGIHPSRVTPKRDKATKALVYEVRNATRGPSTIAAQDMFHVRGPSDDGIVGMSVLQFARHSLGLGIAAEQQAGKMFSNGVMPSGVLMHPGTISEEAADRLKKQKADSARDRGVMLLEEGMGWEQTSLNPDDAQWLETRKFQVSEVARWLNLPPHKLGDMEHATFSNIEHQALEFVIDCLLPWLVRWEEEIHLKLFAPQDRRVHYAKHVVAGLLRGDIKTRYMAYQLGKRGGWLSANDIRELEDMNDLPGDQGNIYEVPLNVQSAADVGKDQGVDKTPPKDQEAARAALRPVIANIFRRMLTKETNAVNRASNRPDGWDDRIGEFYASHRDTLGDALLPAVQAAARLMAPASAPDLAPGVVDAFTARRCEILTTVLRKAARANGNSTHLPAAIAAITADWDDALADTLATNLLTCLTAALPETPNV